MNTPATKKKRLLKKLFIGLGSFFVLILAALIIIPYFFKDEIKNIALKQVNEMLLADVSIGDFDLTILSTFPKLTAQFDDVKITGRDLFQGVELANIKRFSVNIGLWSVISGDKYEIKGFSLDDPKIDVRVLKDGTANYDIVKPDSLKTEEELEEPTPFELSLKHYEINNGRIRYDDKSSDMFAELVNLNHSGSGNLSADVIDFRTKTNMDELTYKMDGLTYLSKVKTELVANILMEFKENSSKFTLEKNKITLNDFTTSIDGFYEMLTNGKSNMDLTLDTKEATFKNLLSLIPAFYKTGYEKMVTDGKLQLNAKVKGVLDDKNYPSWNVGLKVADASVKYPDLPAKINNIQIDAKSSFPGGSDLNKMIVDINKFHLDFLNNKVDAFMRLKNLMTQPNIDGKVNADVNLAMLSQVLPLSKDEKYGGRLKLDAAVKGTYSETIYPFWNVNVNLKNGLVKYPGVPGQVDDIQLDANSTFAGGKDLDKMTLDVNSLHLSFLQNIVDAYLKVRNPITHRFIDSKIKANVNLATLEKIMPMEKGESYKGQLNADVSLKGNVSEVEKGQYNNFKADGTLSLKDLVYHTSSLPKPVSISNMLFEFTPKSLNLAHLKGRMGNSDFSINGLISNYLAYWFNKEQLKGNFNFASNNLDLDELMGLSSSTSSVEEKETEGSSSTSEAISIPANIDFNLNTNIAKVKYDGLDVRNVKGSIGLKNQTAYLDNLTMNAMGGTVGLKGSYNTSDASMPDINFGYDLKSIDINTLATHFVTVGKFAPVLQFVNGKVSSNLTLNSKVKPDFTPILTSLQSLGDFSATSLTISKFEPLSKLGNALKMEKLGAAQTLKDLTAKFKIDEGKLSLQSPLKFNLGKITTETTGYTSLDQTIGYLMKMNIPKEDIPQGIIKNVENGLQKINGLVPQLKIADLPNMIPVNVKIGGTVTKPIITTDIENSIKNLTGNLKNSIKDAAKNTVNTAKDSVKTVVTNKVNEVKKDVSAEIQKRKQQVLDLAQKQADALKDQAKNLANKTRSEGDKAAQKLIDDAGSNFLKKKAAEVAAKKLRGEANKKADKIETEANAKADKIMQDARAKADAIK